MNMKKHVFLFLVAILSMAQSAFAFSNFSAVAPSGQTIYYKFNDNYTAAIVTYPGSSPYDPYNGYSSAPTGDLVIPTSVTYYGYTYAVIEIDSYAFSGCTGLTSVIIPNSVTNIGRDVFRNCTGLTSVSLPNNDHISLIQLNTFYGCTSLTSVTIPSSVTIIGDNAFYGCSSLNSVTIPALVNSIGEGAFACCSGLTSINVASGNTFYDSRDNCNALIKTSTNTLIRGCRNTVIPNSVTSIGNSAFADCYDLTSINIPNSVTSIGNSAFTNCYALSSITISSLVNSIADYTFYDCISLTSVTIPNSVNSIGRFAFGGCTSLTSVTIGSGVTSIGRFAFGSCTSLASVTIGSGVTSIDDYAFSECSNLISITIPVTVSSIGDYAFSDCYALTSITISNAFTSIGSYAFNWCTNLNSVTLGDNNLTVFSNDITKGNAYIYLPYESTTNLWNKTVSVYATANNGYQFVRWNDNDTNDERTVTVTANVTYTAYFDSTTHGIEEIDVSKIKVFVSDGRIIIRGTEGMDVRVYDIMGSRVAYSTTAEEHDIPMQTAGVYLVKVGTLPARKVVVIR